MVYVKSVVCTVGIAACHYIIGDFTGLAMQKEYETGTDFAYYFICAVFAYDSFSCVQRNRSGAKNIIVIVATFLASNIFTIIFGCIWLHYKGHKDTLNGLKRMQIEDLE